MSRRLPSTVLPAAVALGIVTATMLAGCSGVDTPEPSRSATSTRSATPTPTSTSAPSPSSTAAGPSPVATTPSDDQTGSADDGTGPGTGNGSGVQDPSNVDFVTIGKQGQAAAGGGTVLSLTGSGDSWTVVVAGPDGSLTQSVVSATLGRVTSGPFPKDSDAATKAANVARAKAIKVDAPAAASAAARAVAGSTVSSVTLGGSGSAPVWTVTLSVSGAMRTVTVNGVTGATS